MIEGKWPNEKEPAIREDGRLSSLQGGTTSQEVGSASINGDDAVAPLITLSAISAETNVLPKSFMAYFSNALICVDEK